MAYTKRSGSAVQVRQGNTGQLLKTFSGKGAESKAQEYVQDLHAEHHPKASNRGAAAAAKFRKGKK